MYGIRSYKIAKTLEEALELLNGKLKIIAGGTGIVMKLGKAELENINLLNISQIEQLKSIKLLDNGTIEIGTLVTLKQLSESDIINKRATMLKESALTMDNVRIKSVATIGGNICDGEFYYDSHAPLFALNALVRIQSYGNVREIFFSELYDKSGKILIKSNEMITHILIDTSDYKNLFGKYIKYFVRKSFAPSSLGIAVAAGFENNFFSKLRIGINVEASAPLHCYEAENYALGKPFELETYQKIAELAVKELAANAMWCKEEHNRTFIADALFQRVLSDVYKLYLERDVIRISDYRNFVGGGVRV